MASAARGGGGGRALLAALIEHSEAAGIWTIQTGIFPENETSLRLHERVGFRVVGLRERLGQHDGVWRDVVFLERRSPTIAVTRTLLRVPRRRDDRDVRARVRRLRRDHGRRQNPSASDTWGLP